MPARGDHPDAYEVFTQFGEGKPIQYVGSVRAVDPLLAWHAAKEAYTRRDLCTLLWVVPRDAMIVSTPQDRLVLASGDRMIYRGPTFPSAHRRARQHGAAGDGDA